MATASASTLDTVPGRSVQVLPCTAKMHASCWRDAHRLTRFVGNASHDVREMDVRIAWNGEHLIVRNRGQDANESLELVVHPRESNNLSQAQLFVATPGISTHTMQRPPQAGQTNNVRILLRNKETGITRTWSPTGQGDRSRPATLWFSERPIRPPTLAVQLTDHGTWTIESDTQNTVKVVHRRPHRRPAPRPPHASASSAR